MEMPITPGEILLEEYLKPMGISQNTMARAIGVAPRAINEIVHGRRSITLAMSIRFGAFFGQSEQFWHGIQVEGDRKKNDPSPRPSPSGRGVPGIRPQARPRGDAQ
ncbi:MAG: HigA family addiction module antitoxin [Nitrospira sp.]|nr:HigA family addiction module antitoxin [Nitrospira sp.]MDE0487546.1 HigA family addiction module antitoxin [Nitrospira sp.]